eukprot:746574-Hanusia_phi.AAC.4
MAGRGLLVVLVKLVGFEVTATSERTRGTGSVRRGDLVVALLVVVRYGQGTKSAHEDSQIDSSRCCRGSLVTSLCSTRQRKRVTEVEDLGCSLTVGRGQSNDSISTEEQASQSPDRAPLPGAHVNDSLCADLRGGSPVASLQRAEEIRLLSGSQTCTGGELLLRDCSSTHSRFCLQAKSAGEVRGEELTASSAGTRKEDEGDCSACESMGGRC